MAKRKGEPFHQCSEVVHSYEGLARYQSQCSRVGKHEHEGKHYCWQHHPPRVKERDKERRQQWDDNWARERAEEKAEQERRGATRKLITLATVKHKLWRHHSDCKPLSSEGCACGLSELGEVVRTLEGQKAEILQKGS